jgi:hypothetical protein
MTNRSWQPAPEERSVEISSVWFRLIDDFTGRAPIAQMTVHLDIQDGPDWNPLDIKATITTAGMVTFLGLERRRPVAGVPPRHYRVRVESYLYRPLYRQLTSGIEFQTVPTNEQSAPRPVPKDLVLLPSSTYPLPAHVRRVRGQVRDQTDSPVEDVVVSNRVRIGPTVMAERTLTDECGAFTLALRWVTPGSTATVNAIDRRSHEAGTINVAVPADLQHSNLITIV